MKLIKNEESRSDVNGCSLGNDSLAEPSGVGGGTDSGSVDSGDLLGNGGGAGGGSGSVGLEEDDFVKEKVLKKPSFVVGWRELGLQSSEGRIL